MILSEKVERLRRGANGSLTEVREFLVTLGTRHYELPVSEKEFRHAVVGKDYELTLVKLEEKNG